MEEGRKCENVFVGSEDSLLGTDDEGYDGSCEVTDNSLALVQTVDRELRDDGRARNLLITNRLLCRRLAGTWTLLVAILRDSMFPK